jgi:hypothetical protein
MARFTIGLSLVGLMIVSASPINAQEDGQRLRAANPKNKLQGNAMGANNAAAANREANQEMSNLAQILLANYDVDGSSSLDFTELTQAMAGLRELMMRNQRTARGNNNVNNANNDVNANAMAARRDAARAAGFPRGPGLRGGGKGDE